MQYALSLGFPTDKIILFSWSIGGFPAAWLSNHYPEVRAVVRYFIVLLFLPRRLFYSYFKTIKILDACFDHLLPLAQQQMPKFAGTFVEYAVKTNLNLNVSELINK
jgi:hypothetical protein